MIDAQVLRAGNPALIGLERRLEASPMAVWDVLTTEAGVRTWFPCDIAVEEWTVGGSLRFSFRQGELPGITGVILEVDEPRTLSYTWGDEVLRFTLVPDDNATVLRLTDELDRKFAARNAAGWDVCFAGLSSAPDKAVSWRSRFGHYVTTMTPILGTQDGPPPGIVLPPTDSETSARTTTDG